MATSTPSDDELQRELDKARAELSELIAKRDQLAHERGRLTLKRDELLRLREQRNLEAGRKLDKLFRPSRLAEFLQGEGRPPGRAPVAPTVALKTGLLLQGWSVEGSTIARWQDGMIVENTDAVTLAGPFDTEAEAEAAMEACPKCSGKEWRAITELCADCQRMEVDSDGS